jgi:protein involved in polysaccharide export with SLBB domain
MSFSMPGGCASTQDGAQQEVAVAEAEPSTQPAVELASAEVAEIKLPDLTIPVATVPANRTDPTSLTYNPQASTVFPDYRLNVGDIIEVIYHVRTGVTGEPYRLKVEDVISVSFPFQKAFDQQVKVQSDGTIRLLLVGEIVVVKRGEMGLSAFHFRQESDKSWRRFDVRTKSWVAYPFELVHASDGEWMRKEGKAGAEVRLEDALGPEVATPVDEPLIVDVIGRNDKRERYEFDPAQRRWRSRPIFVEQMGLTASELQESLQTAYAKFLRQPEVNVSIQQANLKIEELKKAITTAPRGQSRLMPVKPDGTIDLPFIGEMPAFGKTIQTLKTDVEAAYTEVDLPEISVTVQMNEWAQQKIYVLGEVKNPGLITSAMPLTLMQAVATAGGLSPRAAADQVMVIRRRGLPVPEGALVNLSAFEKKLETAKAGQKPEVADLRFDLYVGDTDVIYIPSSDLAKVGDWADLVFNRIVRTILPYQFYTGLNFGYDLHRETQVNKTRNDGPNLNISTIP